MSYQSKRVNIEYITIRRSTYHAERSPLLDQPRRYSKPQGSSLISFISLLLLFILFIICPLLFYSAYSFKSAPSDVIDYKPLYEAARVQVQRLTADNMALGDEVSLYRNMYEGVRVRAQHLEQENVALEDEMQDLRTKLHDLRGHLMNAKVAAFWEIVRTLDTNMYVRLLPLLTLLMVHLRNVWVGADDPGNDPKLWSYGVTNELYNGNNPPVTSTTLRFTADQAVTLELTEQHRIVGYKIKSNRQNNGWWIATGLNEFGQGGSCQVKFSAKAPVFGGAEYGVIVFHADKRH
jgi:hypothetical protein